MQRKYTSKQIIRYLFNSCCFASLFACNPGDNTITISKGLLDSMQVQIATFTVNQGWIDKNLMSFDTLDFAVFSNQDWTRIHESHSKDIKVNWPDGHFTIGIDQHINDLKNMFVYAPDMRIRQHPIRFGSGNMTCVTGVMTGTFSKSMPIGNGKAIQPTGKSFSIPMCTVGIWKTGVMIEEFLFWDNHAFMKQIGILK